jgi:hypothetical protein
MDSLLIDNFNNFISKFAKIHIFIYVKSWDGGREGERNCLTKQLPKRIRRLLRMIIETQIKHTLLDTLIFQDLLEFVDP